MTAADLLGADNAELFSNIEQVVRKNLTIAPRYRLTVLLRLLTMLILACCSASAQAKDAPTIAWPEPGKRATIHQLFNGLEITVSVSSRTAGAIDSLTWGGTQFINAYDHGRELQSSINFDGYTECFNPTEAGRAADGSGDRSTSLLLSLQVSPSMIQTRSIMSYWISPGRANGTCPNGPGPYKHERSNSELTKRVTLNAEGIPNVIGYYATFTVKEPHTAATFEAPTAYLPPEFSKFWTFDPDKRDLIALSDGPGEQGLPVILATPDGSRAMGVYSPELPQPSLPNNGYGRWRFAHLPGAGNSTVKWNCVFRVFNLQPGDHAFTCFVLIGSLNDVKRGMTMLRTRSKRNRASMIGVLPGNTANTELPQVSDTVGLPLYVGVEGGCNAGEVSIDRNYKKCSTISIGSTIPKRDNPDGIEVYSLINSRELTGLVTKNPHHLGLETQAVGFLQRPGASGTPLYVGTQQGCNEGVVTTNPAHLNCSTAKIGTTR